MAKAWNKHGVHIGLISVGGQVSRESVNLNPQNIALEVWKLYRQVPDEYTVDIEVEE